ncbi:MAG: rhodanese-like domain-containing protein [Cycloclasticus sp.]
MRKSFRYPPNIAVAICLLSAAFADCFAGDIVTTLNRADLANDKHTQSNNYLTAKQAYQALTVDSQQALFIDVRTRAEAEFVGSPLLVDALIPYLQNDFTAWDDKERLYQKTINASFAVELASALQQKGLDQQAVLIFICRSGSRSAKAANLATKLGYTQVYTVVDGFEGDTVKSGSASGQRVLNGWKNSQLPWVY